MPRFPRYERQQGLSTGSTGSFASPGAFTAPADALQNAGGALLDAGTQFEARAQKIQNSQDDTWFSKARAETALQMQQAQNELRQSATDGAQGYTDLVTERYEGLRQQYLDSAPSDRARQMFDEWSHSYTANVVGDAATFQAQSTLAKRDGDFAQAMLSHSQTVLADPNQYESVRKRAMDDLEGAKQWMTPEQEIAARNTVEQQLQLARAQAEIQRDPQAFLKEIGIEQKPAKEYRDAIASIESAGSGDYQAIGPRHPELGRALGRYQIMEANVGPWSLKHLGRRVSVEEFLENPDIQDAIFDGEFGSYVAAYGLEGAAQAWFAGEGGVGKVGRKDSLGTDVASYGKKFLAALGESGSPNVAGNPRFSNLDVNQVLGLQQQAESRIAELQRQEKAARTAQIADIKGAFQLGISTGDSSVTPQAILSSPLPDADKASLINAWESKNKDVLLASDAIAKIDAGAALNPYDSDDKKGVSLAYDAATNGQSLFGDGNAQAVLGYMYGRSGIVPKTAKNEIRAGLLSSDPNMVAAAGSVAAQLFDISPGGLDATENGEELRKAATTYRHMKERLGLTNEEAGRRMIDMRDPEKQRQREALLQSEPIKKRIKDISVNEVRDVFDPGMIGFDPDLGETPMAEASMVGEYREIFRESIVEANGDEELAQELTAQRFARTHGPSPLTLAGNGVVTRLPPERSYPPGPDGTHEYIRNQAMESLRAEGIEPAEVFLEYYEDTEADYRANKPPRYKIWYRERLTEPGYFDASPDARETTGPLQMFNLPFYAVEPEETAVDLTGNQERRERNMRDVEASRDRERNLDAYLEGDPLTGEMPAQGPPATRQREERPLPKIEQQRREQEQRLRGETIIDSQGNRRRAE